MHQLDSGLDIARVERSVRGSQDQLGCCSRAKEASQSVRLIRSLRTTRERGVRPGEDYRNRE
jgi:hypothetical protein